MRPLSETEKHIIRLRDQLEVLRRDLKRAQDKFNFAPRGKRAERLKALRAVNFKVLKAEAQMARLKAARAA